MVISIGCIMVHPMCGNIINVSYEAETHRFQNIGVPLVAGDVVIVSGNLHLSGIREESSEEKEAVDFFCS
jgi:hypothetical protein